MTDVVETVAKSGVEIFVPLNKLKKSPKNARKTPHGDDAIEALAATIQLKGMLQNLVVEPERDGEGAETGCYLVTIGEGRRLAQLLRAKRKQIKKTEPIRCVLDTSNDPYEISLDENVNRTNMHPADEFEAFQQLATEKGYGAEEIGARFGKSAHVVRQRLRLAAVSPKLIQVYRDGGLTLDQLMAFAIREDHARQEQVYDGLSFNREPRVIRQAMTEANVKALDRRAVFVGAEAYIEAGGVILRDLFTEDGGGWFEDVALLDRLTLAKLEGVAEEVQAEGWKWAQAFIDYPHAHGLTRFYPQTLDPSDADQERVAVLSAEREVLLAAHSSDEERPEEAQARLDVIEEDIEALSNPEPTYEPEAVARGGVFVVLNHDGTARIERGFVRPEDMAPEPEAEAEADGEVQADEEGGEGGQASDETAEDPEAGETEVAGPLPNTLVTDLTAHRTLGLRLALGERPDIAMIAMVHTLAGRAFYGAGQFYSCLALGPDSPSLAGHADGIADTVAAKAVEDRHAAWAAQMPQDAADLWAFVVQLDHDSRESLFAHCVGRLVQAVKFPWTRQDKAMAAADILAGALELDMAAYWRPTVRSYFGRVTKAHILEAVREGDAAEVADRMSDMKKEPMAVYAEGLLGPTDWLPALLRTPKAVEVEPAEETEVSGYAHAAE